MEILIMKVLFVIMGIIPISRKMGVRWPWKKVKFDFNDLEQVDEKEMDQVRKIIKEYEENEGKVKK